MQNSYLVECSIFEFIRYITHTHILTHAHTHTNMISNNITSNKYDSQMCGFGKDLIMIFITSCLYAYTEVQKIKVFCWIICAVHTIFIGSFYCYVKLQIRFNNLNSRPTHLNSKQRKVWKLYEWQILSFICHTVILWNFSKTFHWFCCVQQF